LKTYKSLPGDKTAEYLDYLAGMTGCGRFAGDVTDTWMTWDMIRSMRTGGMFIGGHTVNHPVLARLDRARQRMEVYGCAQRLRDELGEPMRWFSYPVGGPDAYNDDTRQCLRECGVEMAFSYRGTYRPLGSRDDGDDYAVPRAAVERYTTLTDLGAVLALPHVLSWRYAGNPSGAVLLRPSV
jgi:peptidoglycan/xylan/chitin deacetylase (PgdA/CDA1 family)